MFRFLVDSNIHESSGTYTTVKKVWGWLGFLMFMKEVSNAH